MFDNNVFDEWLDKKAQSIITAMGEGKALLPEEMMVLVLKAQTNHFNHLVIELRQDMKDLRVDMARDMKDLREDIARDMKNLREDMDRRFEQVGKRFEQVDKRFEQVDKRFEQVDKRFDMLITRIDRLIIWSFATTVSIGSLVVAAIKFL